MKLLRGNHGVFRSGNTSGTNVPLLLDSVSASADGAYALRKIRSSYTGSCVRVRRASDNAETNIGFTSSGALDQDALIAFTGGENYYVRSEEFHNGSAWALTNFTCTPDAVLSPLSGLTADLIVENTASNVLHGVYGSSILNPTTGVVYTASVYAKYAGRNIQLTFDSSGFGGSQYVNFDLQNGVVSAQGGSAVGTITSVGNGWYRCSLTATCTSSAGGNAAKISFISITTLAASRAQSYTGDGVSGFYLWGAQLNTGTIKPYQSTTSSVANTGWGYVTTWYDQSVNGRNGVQTTNSQQPTIVENGMIMTVNSKPAIRFNPSNSTWLLISSILSTTTWSSYSVMSRSSSGHNLVTIANQSTVLPFTPYSYNTGRTFIGGNTTYGSYADTTTGQQMYSGFSISNNFSIYQNSVSKTLEISSQPTPGNFDSIGKRFSEFSQGYIQEALFFSADTLAQRVSIETNMNQYFQIY